MESISLANDTVSPRLNADLVRKYNRPAPRYTSYPTALRFRELDEEFTKEALLLDLEVSEGPLSLYFHLPYCRSLCWFCGCAKVISTDTSLADRYLDFLEKEVALYQAHLQPNRPVVQLHFGGGTPNFLTPAQIDRLGALIQEHFAFAEDAEISAEFDPRTLSQEQVEAFRRLGVNRASIGVQDVKLEVQEAVHRIQPTETNVEVVGWLREAGIGSLNVDLVYGLPCQTPESFAETLEEVLSYDPDRLAIFSYAHVPWSKPAQKILEKNPMPSADEKIEMLIQTVDTLAKRGYAHIGMDHFSKRSDPLVAAQQVGTLQRNFQGYSLHANVEILAFGMSSISQSSGAFRQNHKDLDTYYEMISKGEIPLQKGYLLTFDDQIRREVIMRLMCDLRLDFAERSEANGIDFSVYFAEEIKALQELEEDGLVRFTGKGLEVLPLGRLLIRNVANVFDAYSDRVSKGFSKAI